MVDGAPRFRTADMAKFSIIFPALMHPPSETIRFYYHDVTDHFLVDLKDMKMEKDMSGRVSNLTWMIASPSTDRSYRVSWDWSD